MELSEIGKRIKFRRKELGLTQLQIKDNTGISSGNLSEIEHGYKLPSTPALIALSSVLNCSIDWLLKGELSNNNDLILSDEKELSLIKVFRELPDEEKRELLEISQVILRKVKRDVHINAKSSLSEIKEPNNNAS